MIGVGVDIHKKRCRSCLRDERGRLIEEVSFQRTQKGIGSFPRLLEGHDEAKIILESTGSLRVPIRDHLTEKANMVMLTNPQMR